MTTGQRAGALRAQDVFWYAAEHLSCEQKQKLAHMRQELERQGALLPEETGLADSLSLLRFLKARGWSVAKAVKMYQAMATWRHEQQVDGVLQEQFPELPLVRQHYPQFYHKVDRFGRPVWIELLGHIDVDALLQVTSVDRFLRYHIQCCEAFRLFKLPACSAAAGRPILTQTIILDMSGLSPMRHFTLTVQRILQLLSHVDQNNFPEHLGCLFMINTPLLFRSFWSVIKGFLDERTLAKIKVLGASYKDELLAVIAPENLPVQFGGRSPCSELTDVGPWQDPAVVAACPALRKAAAAGQLLAPSPGDDPDGSCSSLQRGGSFIGTGCVALASEVGSMSSGSSDECGSQSSNLATSQ